METKASVLSLAILVASICGSSSQTSGQASLNDSQLQEQMRQLGDDRDDQEKLRRGRDVLRRHYLSSQQVKAIALKFSNEPARLEFAMAAYPRVVDPENFYEVYDAFNSFSKVMRLHDYVRGSSAPGPAPAPAPLSLTDQEFREMLRALKEEPFDNNRIKLAKQMLSTSRKPFLASHVRQMMECFDSEPSKLELAEFAWDYTLDREKYFLVNQALSFQSSKDRLAKYIASRPQTPLLLEKDR